MKKIDFEAHFYTAEYANYLRTRKDMPREEVGQTCIRMVYGPNVVVPRNFAFEDKLLDLGVGRLEEMDAAGIDIQVLSLALPGCNEFEASEGTALAKQTNDELSKVVNKYPDRFIGLAALAPQDPSGATNELERAVKELGLRGAKIDSHARGEYLDDKKYWGIFEKAESLDVPIYIHPTIPSPSILKPYADYGMPLAGASFGFAAETALHVMRLIYSGLFDKYPGLKIVLGHLGEGLPFWFNRIDFSWLKPWIDEGLRPQIAKKPSEYIQSNFTVTTSGMSFLPAFLCSYLVLGADKIAFGADYPYEASEEAVKSLESMPVCDSDKEKIFHLNAERLFKLS